MEVLGRTAGDSRPTVMVTADKNVVMKVDDSDDDHFLFESIIWVHLG